MKKGYFSVKLIDKVTRQAFREHKKDEETWYVEAEPEREYVVEVRSEATEVVFADIKIDGTLLESGRRIQPFITCEVGAYKRDGDDHCIRSALCFDRTRVLDVGKPNKPGRTPGVWAGCVSVEFFGNPKIIHGNNKDHGTDNVVYVKEWLIGTLDSEHISGKVNCSIREASIQFKKGVNTAKGETVIGRIAIRSDTESKAQKQQKRTKRRKKEKDNVSVFKSNKPEEKEAVFLCKIELRYCSALGLIHNKILPRPPDWDYAIVRHNKPRTDNWKEASEAAVKRLPIKRVVVEGVVVQEAKEVDLFDLTKD